MTYFTEDNIRFAKLSEATITRLVKVPVERFSVSPESIKKIRSILGICKEMTDEDLQAIRNGVVASFSAICDILRRDESPVYDIYQKSMSAITAVIDDEKWNRRMAI